MEIVVSNFKFKYSISNGIVTFKSGNMVEGYCTTNKEGITITSFTTIGGCSDFLRRATYDFIFWVENEIKQL